MHSSLKCQPTRTATLVGYDVNTTQSGKLPICSGYLKARCNLGMPVLLLFHEAPHNENSPTSIMSEHQSREHGFVIDSVSTKHKKSIDGTMGTQRVHLTDKIWIPLMDRGGIMAMETLPISEKDLNEIDPIYDVFEMTSAERWIPHRFRINGTLTHKVKEAPLTYPE